MQEKIFQTNLTKNFEEEIKIIFKIFNKKQQDSIRLVGGCVRDLLLEKEIHDFDFACKFLPEKIIEILKENNIKSIPTGIKYGTITALINNKNFEITTLRKDVENNGRHPKTEFIDDYFFDAKRRDFTINALYLDEFGKIYDYFNGFSDLQNQEVKFIGDAKERIQEDYLRILRFLRFSISYSKNIDKNSLQASISMKNGIKILSAERIYDEFFKFFKSQNHSKIIEILTIFNENFVLEIFPIKLEIQNLKNLFTIEESLKSSFDKKLKFASLIFDKKYLNQDFTKTLEIIFQKLNFSNQDKKLFRFLNENFFKDFIFNEKTITKLLIFYDKNYVKNLFLLKNLENKNLQEIKEKLNFIENFIALEFPVNGDDLLKIGFLGKEIGEILFKLKEIWIENNFQISKKELLSFVKKI